MKLSLQHLITVSVLVLLSACTKHDRAHDSSATQPAGAILFKERCRDCHKIGKQGGETGPELTPTGGKPRSRSFVRQVIRQPASLFPGTVMPPHRDLSGKQIEALIDFLADLK
jgi:mono/diheme cytochrome c family protein